MCMKQASCDREQRHRGRCNRRWLVVEPAADDGASDASASDSAARAPAVVPDDGWLAMDSSSSTSPGVVRQAPAPRGRAEYTPTERRRDELVAELAAVASGCRNGRMDSGDAVALRYCCDEPEVAAEEQVQELEKALAVMRKLMSTHSPITRPPMAESLPPSMDPLAAPMAPPPASAPPPSSRCAPFMAATVGGSIAVARPIDSTLSSTFAVAVATPLHASDEHVSPAVADTTGEAL
jgi:hypothetical protein